jgi:hypothetical protein
MSAAHAYEEMHQLVDQLSPDQVRRLLTLVKSDPELVAPGEHGSPGTAEPAAPDDTPDSRLSFVASCEGGPTDLAERSEDYLREYFNNFL